MHPHPLLAALFSFANGYPQPCPPCLRVANWNECPSEATGNQLPNCRSFSFGVGEQCEGDGECGTSRTENNCNGNQDVYVRCESNIPDPPRPPPGPSPTPTPIHSPPPPFPPFAPLPACSATAVCSAGASCGLCLRSWKDECSSNPFNIAAAVRRGRARRSMRGRWRVRHGQNSQQLSWLPRCLRPRAMRSGPTAAVSNDYHPRGQQCRRGALARPSRRDLYVLSLTPASTRAGRAAAGCAHDPDRCASCAHRRDDRAARQDDKGDSRRDPCHARRAVSVE